MTQQSPTAVRMARIIAETTGDQVRADGNKLIVDRVGVSTTTRAHISNNGWCPTDSHSDFVVYEQVE